MQILMVKSLGVFSPSDDCILEKSSLRSHVTVSVQSAGILWEVLSDKFLT